MVWRIPKNSLAKIKQTLKKNHEICGICIGKDGDILELEYIDNGPPIEKGEVGSCRSTNKWINFHTHPTIVWPWPSTEDVFKVLRKRDGKPLYGSLIFTEWGIWEIYAANKVEDSYLTEIEESWTQYTSDKLFYDLELTPKSKPPAFSKASEHIISYLDKWSEIFWDIGLDICLTSWNGLEQDQSYQLQTELSTLPSE
jgi:hypothetical protein